MKKLGYSLLAPRILLRGLVFIAILAVIGWLFNELGLKSMLETTWIDDEIRNQGLSGKILFIALGAISTAIGIPRQIIAFLSGYAFGIMEGTAFALTASLLGASITFGAVRIMGDSSQLISKFPQKLQRIRSYLAENTITTVLILRLVPFSSNFLLNIAASLARISFIPFILATAIGSIPQALIFTLLGSGLEINPLLSTIISALLFICATILGIWLWRSYLKQHGLSTTDDGIT